MSRLLIALFMFTCSRSNTAFSQEPLPIETPAQPKNHGASSTQLKSGGGRVSEEPPPPLIANRDDGKGPANDNKNEGTTNLGVLQLSITGLQTVLNIILGVVVYRLNRRVRSENQLEFFRNLHKEFWTSVELRKVRHWLACPDAYAAEVAPVLAVRNNSPCADSKGYEVLETLDNFLNFMTTVVVLSERFFSHRQKEVLDETYFGYWIAQTLDEERRPELAKYVRMFYSQVVKAAEQRRKNLANSSTGSGPLAIN